MRVLPPSRHRQSDAFALMAAAGLGWRNLSYPDGSRELRSLFSKTQRARPLIRRRFSTTAKHVSAIEVGFGAGVCGLESHFLFLAAKTATTNRMARPSAAQGWGQQDRHEILNSFAGDGRLALRAGVSRNRMGASREREGAEHFNACLARHPTKRS